jgi:hypothetical protein
MPLMLAKTEKAPTLAPSRGTCTRSTDSGHRSVVLLSNWRAHPNHGSSHAPSCQSFCSQATELENQIDCLIAASVALAEIAKVLRTAPRIDPVTSTLPIDCARMKNHTNCHYTRCLKTRHQHRMHSVNHTKIILHRPLKNIISSKQRASIGRTTNWEMPPKDSRSILSYSPIFNIFALSRKWKDKLEIKCKKSFCKFFSISKTIF